MASLQTRKKRLLVFAPVYDAFNCLTQDQKRHLVFAPGYEAFNGLTQVQKQVRGI